jgi:hypothetical protein
VAKAGTTNLHTLLASHPDVFMSTPKEPHFLATPEATPEAAYALNAVRDEAAYLHLFADATEPLRGESSTTNWWRPATAARIDAFSPGSRAIVILRDPVERAFSHYLNDVRDSHESRPFDATIPTARPGPASLRWGDPLIRAELGFYADRLQAYREVFGERLLVLTFEDWLAEPGAVLEQISSFLALEPDLSTEAASLGGTNSHRAVRGHLSGYALRSPRLRKLGRRLVSSALRARAYDAMMKKAAKPPLEPVAERQLRQLYASDTAATSELLGRPLAWKSAVTTAAQPGGAWT